MDSVFLAYSNDPVKPLKSLREEDETVYGYLADRGRLNHFYIHRDSYATIDSIRKHLIKFREQLILFHFSGHAGRDRLLFEGQSAEGPGIAELLDQCPRLRLVFLNGCATHDQVARLAKLKSRPIIIATYAEVNDLAACRFAQSFYQVLSEPQKTLYSAFQMGTASARLTADLINIPEGPYQSGLEKKLWGLFYPSKLDREWILPMEAQIEELIPNAYLLDQLYAAFNIEEIGYSDGSEENRERNEIERKKFILMSLPRPVSQQLAKLLVHNEGDDNSRFYDRVDIYRVRQLEMTFRTVIELVSFAMLSQLWDWKVKNKSLAIPIVLKDQIKSILTSGDKKPRLLNLINTIEEILKFLASEEQSAFISELSNFETLQNLEKLKSHCQHFDLTVAETEQNHPTDKIENLCREGEKMVADLFCKWSFLIHYSVASVKDIDVIKFKHFEKPRFKHRLIRLVETFVGTQEEYDELEHFMDIMSVSLIKSENGVSRFLNLSPFVMDENAFSRQRHPKIRFFQCYDQVRNQFWFKHVYMSFDHVMIIDKQVDFEVIGAQFDAFSNLIFGTDMKDIA